MNAPLSSTAIALPSMVPAGTYDWLTYVTGDVTTVTEGVLVHGCNCMGVMGAGVGRQIRERFPDAYRVYQAHAKAKRLGLGLIQTIVHEQLVEARLRADKAAGLPRRSFAGIDRITQDRRWPPALILINAMTQHDYGRIGQQVDYPAVTQALGRVFRFAAEFGIDQIHMPKIGTGLGGGNWERVEPLLVQAHRAHPDAHVAVWSLAEAGSIR